MKTEALETLSKTEQTELARLEKTIRSNEKAATAYIDALREIRDKRLYRSEFATFAEYCQSKWAKSYRAINMSIQAETIREDLGSALPKRETEARSEIESASPKAMLAIGKLAPVKRIATVKKIVGKKKRITTATVKTAARSFGAYSGKGQSSAAYTTGKKKAPVIDVKVTLPLDHINEVVRRVEAVYDANKAKWNTPPPPSPRAVIDAVLAAVKA